jgi:hypothetical protein
MSGRIGLALTVYLGVIFFQIMIVESLPRTNAFTTMHLFMFLSSVFNGIIVLEHVLVYALNVLVAERAGRVLRIKKLKLDVRAVRSAIRLQRAFRNRRIHIWHKEALNEFSIARQARPSRASVAAASTTGPIAVSAMAVNRTAVNGIAVSAIAVSFDEAGVTVMNDSARASSPSGSAAAVHETREADDIRPSWPGFHEQLELFHEQLEMRMKMALSLSAGRERKRAVVRKIYDCAAIFLKDANRFFTIITMVSYFIGVFYLVR